MRQTAANTYGEVIRVTTFGESHGAAIGAVLDGVQPGVEISEDDIQKELDRRRPGQSKVVTQRRESDRVHILSGVYEGKTTGAPIAMVIYNEDQRSMNYDNLKDLFRPGHGDFTFYSKYGLRDHRGGGRQSGRETACR
ncbi:MAG TPA: chorismate synthase, partial [Candidatus Hydrogenedentes bacterium]|nr:chorismate synthase [Candidatus Hydrogenedentota bacterium]